MARAKLAVVQEPVIACCAPIAAEGLRDEEAEATARLFRALGDRARIRILNILLWADRPVRVRDLVPATGLAQPTVSFHLKKLLETGLLRREQRGTFAYYSVDQEAMDRLRHMADIRKGTRRPM